MEKILKLYTFVDGINDTPFPNQENQIEIDTFRYDAKRMGDVPTIAATVKYPTCLDEVWTPNVYAEFNGEKYYRKQTPTSSYSNAEEMFVHELELVSERIILNNVYFYDAVSDNIIIDRPVSNSTKFTFFGDIRDFAYRLNQSLAQSGILIEYADGSFDGYKAFVDEGVSSEEQLVSFENQFFSNAIQAAFTTYKIPYYFKGREIHFGYSDDVPTQVFKEGVDNELLSVKKENANYKVVNRATGTGSSDNIPFYYPNNSPSGEISATAPARLGAKIVDYEKYASSVQIGQSVVFSSHGEAPDVTGIKISDDGVYFRQYGNEDVEVEHVNSRPFNIWFKLLFTPSSSGAKITGNIEDGATTKDITEYLNYASFQWGDGSAEIKNGYVECKGLSNEPQSLVLGFSFPYDGRDKYSVSFFLYTSARNYWTLAGKEISLSDIGLYCSGPALSGDTITQTLVKYIKPTKKLMPSIYRETEGKERFYNALNDTYTDEDGDDVVFPNPFVQGRPQEQIAEFEHIKPTIKEMTNSLGQRIDMFSAIGYDVNDNDETYIDENGKTMFKHPHFFVKLRKLPFNLFDQAIEGNDMTVSFTSGVCGACEFKIKVDEEFPYANPVQVDANGNLKYDENGMVLCGVEGSGQHVMAQPRQQDTVNNEVWIALEKSEETYGILMPKAPVYSGETLLEAGYRPKACTSSSADNGDTFVLLNINLPKEYITAAEKKLEQEIVKYMLENNLEKFNFSIKFSRIYFEENPDVLALLNENTRLNIEYNGTIYTLYVSSFSYNMTADIPLPEIQVELVDTLEVSQNALQNAISEVKEQMSASLNNMDILAKGTPFFLRKDVDDIANGVINFRRGVQFSDGGKVEVDENNNTKLTIDYLDVKKKAVFTSLEIQEKTHVGGQLLITAASILCNRVEEVNGAYRCYFQNFSEEGDEIFNEYAVGDQAICQTFNAWRSKYYWRLVTGLGPDYIDLSIEDCDVDSDIPSAGDKIIQLGHRTDKDRQNAITLSAHGSNSPSIILYAGINSFSLAGKNITGIIYNPETKEPQMYSYGDFFFGDRTLTEQFITFQKKIGDEKKKLFIDADIKIGAGSSGLTNLSEWSSKQEQIDNAQQTANEAKNKINELQDQIDGVIETFNGFGAPALNNYPANEWTTDEERKRHNQDVYTDITPYVDDATTPTSGQSWRWYYNSPTDYGWVKIADSDAVRALQLASLSVIDTDVLFISHTSQTVAPALPTVNSSGVITNLNGWQTTAPEWRADRYIWQTTYVKKGDGTASFSAPTCIQGAAGESVTITDTEVMYSTVHTATQPSDNTFTLTSVPALSAGQYLWSRTKVTYSNRETTVSYAVSRIGSDGTSVSVSSTSVTYAKTTDSVQPADSAFIYSSIGDAGPSVGDFLWTKTVVNYSDGSFTKSYTVSRIGSDGADGLPGTPGADGQTSYVHFAYASSADGVTDFSTSYFAGALYIGTCTTYTPEDPATPSSYVWARLKGEDGRGIVSSTEWYALSASNTVPPADSEFDTTIPVTTETNRYLWNYEVTTYSDNTSERTGKRVIGVHGANGTDGAGISSIVNYYLASELSTGVTTSTGGWTTNASAASATISKEKPYLWNYEVVNYTKGSPTTTAPHIVGKYGDTGRGIASIKEQYYLSTSNTELAGGSWSDTKQEWTAGKYFWTRTVITYTDGTSVITTPICVTGEKGTDGESTYLLNIINAMAGIVCDSGGNVTGTYPSPKAEVWQGSVKLTSGVAYSIHSKSGIITASIGADGTVTLSALGSDTAMVTVQAVVNGVALQAVISLYKAKAGANGTSVTVTSTSIGYQSSASGTAVPTGTWSTSVPSVPAGHYLWTRTIVNYSNGQSTTSYSVARQGANGADGTPGADGRGVVSTTVEYQIGTSGTTAPTGTWSTAVPAAQKGKYLWTRTTVTYTSGSPSVLYSVAYYATDGTNGKDGVPGKDGVGIISTTIQYAKSTSNTTAPTSGWQSTIPSVPAGQYLWTWTKWKYSDNSEEDGYSVARQGANGADGTPVTITSTEIRYAKGNYPTQPADSAFTLSDIGTLTKGQYLWTRTTVNYSDGVQTKSYTVAYIGSDGSQGLPGTPGADGQTFYVHFAYASGITGSLPHPSAVTGFSTSAFAGAKYIGVCSDNNVNDPTTNVGQTYEWSEYKGETGEAAVVYEIEPSTTVVTKSVAGVLSASSVNCTVYKVTGNTARVATNDHTLKYTRYPDGATGTLSRTGGVSSSVAVTKTTTFVVFELYSGSVLLDRERVAVISDASDMEIGGINMIRNSGFTGDYLSEQLSDNVVMEGRTELFSSPFDHWTAVGATVQASTESVSGKEVVLAAGSLTQALYFKWRADTDHVLSFKAKGTGLKVKLGTDAAQDIALTSAWKQYIIPLHPTASENTFAILSATCTLCDLQLQEGNKATSWNPSPWDNQSDRAYYEALWYLSNAMNEGSTDIEGGLVLTNHIKVGNYANHEMIKETGGMQGTWVNDNSPFLWGGGTNEEAIAAINAYSSIPSNGKVTGQANFAVTHGGRLIANDAIIRGAIYATRGKFSGEIEATTGTIGGFDIGENWLKASGVLGERSWQNQLSAAMVYLTHKDTGGSSITSRDKYNTTIEMRTYPSSGVSNFTAASIKSYVSKDMSYSLTNTGIYVDVTGGSENHAIYAAHGNFAGLRPFTRVLTAGTTLDITDVVVVMNNSSSATLRLPSPAEKGHWILLYHTTSNTVSVNCNFKEIRVVRDGTVQGTLPVANREIWMFLYDGTYWEAGLLTS